MKPYLLPLLAFTFICQTMLGQRSDDHSLILKSCLTDYKFDAKNNEFKTEAGEKVNIEKIDVTQLNDNLTATIWTSVGARVQPSTMYDIALYVLKKDAKGYSVLSSASVIAEYTMLNKFSTEFYMISDHQEALAITYGRDTDGDGDDIHLKLYAFEKDEPILILEHTLRDDSGDGCETSSMESKLSMSDEVTEGHFNFVAEENTSTSNACNENEEERCEKTKTYKYVWDGQQYQNSIVN
jgi:hypothetical protein